MRELIRNSSVPAALRAPAAALGLVLTSAGAALAQQGPELVEIDNTAPQATKLVILLVFLVFVVFGMRRLRVPDIIRSAAIWLAALVVLVGLYTYRGPVEMVGRDVLAALVPGTSFSEGGRVSVNRSWGGQFVLRGEVDGANVEFLFDTGASLVVLSAADAAHAGFDPATLDYRIPVMTASGLTEVAPVRIPSIRIGSIEMQRVRGAVARPGDLDTSLLGMSFLDRLDGYEVRRDRLVLNP